MSYEDVWQPTTAEEIEAWKKIHEEMHQFAQTPEFRFLRAQTNGPRWLALEPETFDRCLNATPAFLRFASEVTERQNFYSFGTLFIRGEASDVSMNSQPPG